MGDDKRKNIMAVDLAIQRELAYRKKVEMLGLEPYGDSGWKDFLPLQVPSSSPISSPQLPCASLVPSVPKKKQEAPSSSTLQRLVPHPIVIPTPNTNLKPRASSSLSPRVTEMKQKAPISSVKMRQEAPSSSGLQRLVPHPIVIPTPNTNRKPWASSSLSPRVTEMKQKAPFSSLKSCSDNLFCKVCQVPCSGPRNFKMHIRGRQHAAKVKDLKLGRKDGGQKSNKPEWCELCKIWCTDGNSIRLHLEGQKHMAKLQKLEGDGKVGGEEANQRQWCGLCKIWCMDESAFKQHLEGKKHITKLHMFKENKGPEDEEVVLALGWEGLE